MYISIYIFGGEDWGHSDFRAPFLEDMSLCFCSRSKEIRPIRLYQLASEFVEIMTFCPRSNEIWPFRIPTIGCSCSMCIENAAYFANENNQNRREIYSVFVIPTVKYSGPELHFWACIIHASLYIMFS